MAETAKIRHPSKVKFETRLRLTEGLRRRSTLKLDFEDRQAAPQYSLTTTTKFAKQTASSDSAALTPSFWASSAMYIFHLCCSPPTELREETKFAACFLRKRQRHRLHGLELSSPHSNILSSQASFGSKSVACRDVCISSKSKM